MANHIYIYGIHTDPTGYSNIPCPLKWIRVRRQRHPQMRMRCPRCRWTNSHPLMAHFAKGLALVPSGTTLAHSDQLGQHSCLWSRAHTCSVDVVSKFVSATTQGKSRHAMDKEWCFTIEWFTIGFVELSCHYGWQMLLIDISQKVSPVVPHRKLRHRHWQKGHSKY